MRPHLANVLSTRFCNSAFEPILHGTPMASWPAAVNSFVTASTASALRLETTTFAPARAISSAIDLPMPLVEPVINATFPVRSNMSIPRQ